MTTTRTIDRIAPEYRDEMMGAMKVLLAKYVSGDISAEMLTASQGRLFDAYASR